jgi:hypothetical protein
VAWERSFGAVSCRCLEATIASTTGARAAWSSGSGSPVASGADGTLPGAGSAVNEVLVHEVTVAPVSLSRWPEPRSSAGCCVAGQGARTLMQPRRGGEIRS